MDSNAPKQTRDRGATQMRILDAAQTILTQSGPAGFGVNAVARMAGVDKQLIYRYFDGLDGLLEALGDRIAVWWHDRLMDDMPGLPPASYSELIERLSLRLLHILRTEPLAQQAALWEMTGESGIVRPFAEAKAKALTSWVARIRGDLAPPEGIDAAAVNAMLIASVSYMVVASRTSDRVIGLAMRDAQTWDRIEAALVQLVRGAYGR